MAYSDYQKSVPIKLASLLILIAICRCFDSLSRIYSGLQKLLYRSRLLQTAIAVSPLRTPGSSVVKTKLYAIAEGAF